MGAGENPCQNVDMRQTDVKANLELNRPVLGFRAVALEVTRIREARLRIGAKKCFRLEANEKRKLIMLELWQHKLHQAKNQPH